MSLPKEETPLFLSNVYPHPSISASSLPALSVLLQSFLEERCRHQLEGYVWLREAPKVAVNISADAETTSQLVVSMRHGGSIEDEWLAVHLLMLATNDVTFSQQALLHTLEGPSAEQALRDDGGGLIIDAKDEDGQFLLIEAADHLPKWVQPDNADGRLWMYQGHLHLISPQIHPGDLSLSASVDTFDGAEVKGLKVQTALGILRRADRDTRAPPSLEQAIIKQRMPSYPALTWASYNQHNTLAYLPAKAAQALYKHPQLFSVAAEYFDGREGPADARHLREMKVFGLPSAGEKGSAVLVKVKMPRRSYATLLTQRYFPPKAFGEGWRKSVSTYWEALEMASRGESDGVKESESLDGRRHDVGCKITCGLELAFAAAKERSRGKANDLFSDQEEVNLRKSPSYAPFIASLTNIGYFGEEVRDSQAWKKREKEAIRLWQMSQPGPELSTDGHASDHLGHLLDLVAEEGRSPSTPPHFDPTLPAHALAIEEDPDAFLYDAPDQFKAAEEASARTTADEEGETEEERAAMHQVNAFASKLQGFVDGKGDEVGALFEDEEMESEGGDSEEDEEEGQGSGKRRVEELSLKERDEAMKNLIPALAREEWGAKETGPQQKHTASEGSAATIENMLKAEAQEEEVATLPSAGATGFSRRVQYDGASDSEESVDDEVLRAGDTEEDRANRAKWLGLEKELEEDNAMRRKSEAEAEADLQDGGDEEGDVTLGQDDLMNFIEFTRKELGLSVEQYEDILQQRRERGAYVPGPKAHSKAAVFSQDQGKRVTFDVPPSEEQPSVLEDAPPKSRSKVLAEKREEKERAMHNRRTSAQEKEVARQKAQMALEEAEASAGRQRKGQTAQLDPFEQLMHAMDEELSKHRHQRDQGTTATVAAEKMEEEDRGDRGDSDEEMLDEMSAEDAELLEKMLHSGPPASLRALMEKQARGGGDPNGGLSSVEEEVLQSMLASYQAQMGGAGPVGALAGRLGVGSLPSNADR